MFTLWLLPQFLDDFDTFILQLKGVPPHWSVNVRDYPDERLSPLPMHVINNMPLIQRPPRSPDLTLRDFFLWCM
ncbi:hypothetical protein TNCV_1627251 [Trichonephila clavipes]|nr:hypothetical protein TNCV_1627251 [Trichonephila clavipes]